MNRGQDIRRSEIAMVRSPVVRGIGILALLLLVGGCARLNSIHRTTDIADDARVISVDAKQRFLVSRHTASTSGQEAIRKFCAEPSPDVFSAFAASLSGSAKTEAFEAALDAAFSENAATIGIRTQAIQLLRDGMYRICEGALNGQVDDDDFLDLHRRYQRIMVTLVAIEQLTGAVRPPSVAIQTDALAGRPARLRDLQAALDETREKIAEARTKKEEEGKRKLSSAGDDDDATCANPGEDVDISENENCKAYLAAKSTLEDEEKNKEALEESIENARSELVNSASGTVTLADSRVSGFTLDSKSVKQISETVQEMVQSLFRLDPDSAIKHYAESSCPVVFETKRELEQAEQIRSEKTDQVVEYAQSNLSAIRFGGVFDAPPMQNNDVDFDLLADRSSLGRCSGSFAPKSATISLRS